jgi:hypothetical protein
MKRITAGAAVIALLTPLAWTSVPGSTATGAGDPITSGGIRDGAGATVSAVAVRVRKASGAGPSIAGCPLFPADHPYNQRVDALAVRSNSNAIITSIQNAGPKILHPDFSENPADGQRLNIVGEGQPLVPIRYTQYPQESDPGPYPIPDNAEVQVGEDKHLYVLDAARCRFDEFYLAGKDANGWYASNGASWDSTVWAPRPRYWTSAVAAGLPAIPLHAHCEEMNTGQINHALGVAMSIVGSGFVAPASHTTSNSGDPNAPVYGMRFRLKADFDTSGYTGQAKVFLETFKAYGLILLDIGANWHIGGFKGDCWRNSDLEQLWKVPGTAFEVVDTGPVEH